MLVKLGVSVSHAEGTLGSTATALAWERRGCFGRKSIMRLLENGPCNTA